MLNFGKAVAVTFDQYYFQFKIKVSSNIEHTSSIKIESSFFSSNFVQFSCKELEQNSTIADKKTLFFIQLLQPWKQFIQNRNIEISILNSFSPSLGFGSSSAIIAGISAAFNTIFLNDTPIFSNPILWKNIRQSIKNIQGKGSGYDVAIQLAHYLIEEKKDRTEFWTFQNQINSEIPNVTKFNLIDDIKLYGCFLKTNIYSDTKKAIHIFSQNSKKEDYAASHTKLAEHFIAEPTLKNLNYLMEESFLIANKQNILPLNIESFNNLTQQLKAFNIKFKTMGAGHGDCLWVLSSPENLIKNCNILKNDIVFAFSKVGDLNE
ncbi:hypothetical protein QEJ31_11260 [Pigmentibacter sp. JX0631]|uniref:GHMP family kinase ATP-binding protein n=1 Tax=Pigmentibacter sp. JX0631 TaxID=2976982 RepID=UPI0024695A8B|nr:hypothetical protein [Pigmentibacter sp. JX0631]WGL59098.1 hypothetical protein QEJ31_11260 [Pigmentibacter sp. JX0631]